MPDNGKRIVEDGAREEAIKQAMCRGDFDQAERLCHQWIAAVEEHWVPFAQMTLADLVLVRRDYDEAGRLIRDYLETAQELGDRHRVAIAQGKLADLAMRRGDYAEAERLQCESLAVYENLGDKRGVAGTQGALADLAMRRGDFDQAEPLFTQAVTAMQDLGDRQQAAVMQGSLAQLLIVTNRGDEGCAMLKEVAQTLRSMGALRDADIADQIIRENCAPSLQQEPPDILDLIATNTITVMTGHKDRREEWFGAIQHLKINAQQYDDAPMITLADAVLKLLGGDSIELLQPELEGPFAACWDRIAAGIKSPPE